MQVIDPWMNADMPEWKDDWMVVVAERYLGSGRHGLRRLDLSELLETMDANGVQRAVLDLNADDPSPHTLAIVEAAPERFALAVRVDPRSIMTAVRRIREAHRNLPVAAAKIVPFIFDVPPSAACYYPTYTVCTDLGLPIMINAGIPGPPVASACQDPIHLDRVCSDFPELTVVMAHGADPWWDVAIRLMIKWPGLHLMTSAYRPRYLPEQLLQYMRTRGRAKVLFASDHPLLELEKCLADVRDLDFNDDLRDAYLHGNAERLFFNQQTRQVR